MAAALVTPDALKQIKPYTTLATQLEQKNEKAVAYYCRLYALQQGMSINKSAPDCKKFLTQLMDILETTKSQNKNDEAIQSQIVGQAKVEEFALKLFDKADEDDRNSNFHKNLVKSFYSAGLLFDVLNFFDELSEDLIAKKKYAKCKAMYLNKCFQSGETPIAGPLISDEGSNEEPNISNPHDSGPSLYPGYPNQPSQSQLPPSNAYSSPVKPTVNDTLSPRPKSSNQSYTPETTHYPKPTAGYQEDAYSSSSGAQATISPELIAKAQKHAKYATNALNYDDIPTAISNLEDALKILKTGK